MEHFQDQNGTIIYIRAVQEHSHGARISPTFFSWKEVPSDWADRKFYTGSSPNSKSVVENGPGRRNQFEKHETSLFLLTCGKNMLDVCCDLTPYETSRWLELKPDRENVTRSGTGSKTYGTNATPEWVHRNGQDLIRMSARAYMSSHGNDAVVVGCTEVLFQPSFSVCCLTRCPQSMSWTRWLRYGVASVSSHEMIVAHVIHEVTVTSCVVSSPGTRRQLIVPSEPSLRAPPLNPRNPSADDRLGQDQIINQGWYCTSTAIAHIMIVFIAFSIYDEFKAQIQYFTTVAVTG